MPIEQKPEQQLPAPGSDAAVAAGCTCPRMDNGFGGGYLGGAKNEHGETLFVINGNCPLHGREAAGER